MKTASGSWPLDEANERELGDQALLYGVAATRQSVPADASYGFLECRRLGVGSSPGGARGVLYAGIAGDEIESGLFEGKQ